MGAIIFEVIMVFLGGLISRIFPCKERDEKEDFKHAIVFVVVLFIIVVVAILVLIFVVG
jgi:hypothetical protein